MRAVAAQEATLRNSVFNCSAGGRVLTREREDEGQAAWTSEWAQLSSTFRREEESWKFRGPVASANGAGASQVLFLPDGGERGFVQLQQFAVGEDVFDGRAALAQRGGEQADAVAVGARARMLRQRLRLGAHDGDARLRGQAP